MCGWPKCRRAGGGRVPMPMCLKCRGAACARTRHQAVAISTHPARSTLHSGTGAAAGAVYAPLPCRLHLRPSLRRGAIAHGEISQLLAVEANDGDLEACRDKNLRTSGHARALRR